MSRSDGLVALCLTTNLGLGLSLWPIDAAQAQPPREKQREDLMDKLGLPKHEPKPKPEPPEDAPSDDDDDDDRRDDEPRDDAGGEAPSSGAGSSAGASSSARSRVTYTGKIRRQLASDCESCHASDGVAGTTRLVITGDLDADYRSARRLVDTAKPAASLLLTKATGQAHAGGATYSAGSAKAKALLAWIEGGAAKGGGGKSTTPAPTPGPASGGTPKADGKPKPGKAGEAGEAGKSTASSSEPAEPTEPAEPPASWIEPGVEPPSDDTPRAIAYAPTAHEILQRRCASCHAAGSFASTSALSLTDDPARDYLAVRDLVRPDDPESSPLLLEGRGQGHAGGAVLEPGSEDDRALLAWIETGAHGPTEADLPAPGARTEPAPADVEVDATTRASPNADDRLGDGTPVPASSPSRLPFSLPFHLRLNGRFDLSYERRDYEDHPFKAQGRNALQTYHHFVFLSRSGADDPFGFNVELLTQQFYEFNARFETRNRRAKFLIKAGKIMVPFGDEPLFHSSYGGRTGFDQQLLPVIWSTPGLAVNAHVTAGPVSFTNDVYAIQGFGLRSPDGVLNLQGDVSTFDDFRFGFGDRIGVSWAPLTAWYSIQVNPLGFDRRLVMQAFDVEFWRLRDVPVLDDLVVGFGAVRADVSGGGPEVGGPGLDYYHFGSYGKIRYYPVDWLYLQYRWGLKTVDNRRGLYYDATRADERDGSSHNLTIGATYKGFFTALQLFWNLEKANEQDNDFLRFTVGYAF